MAGANEDDTPKRQAIRAQIDENLKRVYAQALSEELPDRFKDLLAQLKNGTAASTPDKSGTGDTP
ncbi:MAG: hypothetical protein JNN06_02150 [Gemmobacter sp.]|uniref:NepR family anti-sigma factor n=1 Tax=Gemmobacter sp. TaxID=1898957 RepID=UPI001A5A4EE8|nr:NepR family anti-sigma factor [Gemmobacter sp.]MBL8561057.1 hypothetical protein [Gemmobacter sp.]